MPDRERQMAAVRSVLEEVGAKEVPVLDVFNKLDKLDDGERTRLTAMYPGAIVASALTGEGRDELIAAIESRLALDTTLVHLQFDAASPSDRERIAHLYRVGRILRHESADGHVAIEAEVPRRVVGRFQDVASAGVMKQARFAAFGLTLALCAGCGPKVLEPPPTVAVAKYPDFMFPTAPPDLGTPAAQERHKAGWLWLQAGDLESRRAQLRSGAESAPRRSIRPRSGSATWSWPGGIKTPPSTTSIAPWSPIPATRRRSSAAATRCSPSGQRDMALKSFEAAVVADRAPGALAHPHRGAARSRPAGGRRCGAKGGGGGPLRGGARAYERAIAASPDSPFLHRELADVVRRARRSRCGARSTPSRRARLDPADARAQIMHRRDLRSAAGSVEGALPRTKRRSRSSRSDAIERKIEGLRAALALAAMPAEFHAIESSPTSPAEQLAALVGVRLDGLFKQAGASQRRRDHRRARAAGRSPWILAVTRAGVMEVYPNHTFQPDAVVRRGDLAEAASRVLVADRGAKAGAGRVVARRQARLRRRPARAL